LVQGFVVQTESTIKISTVHSKNTHTHTHIKFIYLLVLEKPFRSAHKWSFNMMVAAVEARSLSETLLLQNLPGPQNKLLVRNVTIRLPKYSLDGIAKSSICFG
jgi:hypothetical protein